MSRYFTASMIKGHCTLLYSCITGGMIEVVQKHITLQMNGPRDVMIDKELNLVTLGQNQLRSSCDIKYYISDFFQTN